MPWGFRLFNFKWKSRVTMRLVWFPQGWVIRIQMSATCTGRASVYYWRGLAIIKLIHPNEISPKPCRVTSSPCICVSKGQASPAVTIQTFSGTDWFNNGVATAIRTRTNFYGVGVLSQLSLEIRIYAWTVLPHWPAPTCELIDPPTAGTNIHPEFLSGRWESAWRNSIPRVFRTVAIVANNLPINRSSGWLPR
jgi:hypothetical protein